MLTIRKPMQHTQSQSEAKYGGKEDFQPLYWESTQETLIGLYAQRDSVTGQPTENLNDIIYRVAFANAIAELKYVLSPQQLTTINLQQALEHARTRQWADVFAHHIGTQKFWAN